MEGSVEFGQMIQTRPNVVLFVRHLTSHRSSSSKEVFFAVFEANPLQVAYSLPGALS